jgi:hypothetical protein
MKKQIYLFLILATAIAGCQKQGSAPASTPARTVTAASLSTMPDSIISNDSTITFVYAGGRRVTREIGSGAKALGTQSTVETEERSSVSSAVPLYNNNPAVLTCYGTVEFKVVKVDDLPPTRSVKAVSDMLMKLSANSTTEHFNGGTVTWYTTLSGERYTNSGIGRSSVTLYWAGSAAWRQTYNYDAGTTSTSDGTTIINHSKTVSAY